ncbi:MAG: beta-glycosidase, partial [Bacteroidaceae bacterium]|nr:beta-glycosidase [Bacteroidaceae bacterium]
TQDGAQRGATFRAMVDSLFGPSHSVDDFCRRAQWVNYDGYRALFESRSAQRRGLLLWMSHPAWPSMVWQTYDYYFDPTAAFFGCQRACEPLHIQWNAATGHVEVVNYSAGSHQGLMARAEVWDTKGRLCWADSARIDSDEDTTLPLMTPRLHPTEQQLLRLTLTDAKRRRLSHNDYIHGAPITLESAPGDLLRCEKWRIESAPGERTYCVTVTNEADCLAPMVRMTVRTPDGELVLPAFFSDNYITLLPGEERTVTVTVRDEDCRGEEVVVGI